MRKADAVKVFGSHTAIAEALQISVQAVGQWDNIIPEGSAYKLQVLTGGRLQVNPASYRNRPKRGQTLNGSRKRHK